MNSENVTRYQLIWSVLVGVLSTLLVLPKSIQIKSKALCLRLVFTQIPRRKQSLTSVRRIIGSKIDVNTLVIHHKRDACKVTQFKHAKSFYDGLQAPKKHIILFNGGVPTGGKCGPFHYHGYEKIEEDAAKKIIEWVISDVVK